MTAMKEQIAQHTSAQTTQQQLPDDPLAPKPIRFTQQQARVTQAYPPDYEDADEPSPRPPRSAMRYQDMLPHQYRGQTVLPAPPEHLRRQRLTGHAPGPKPHAPRRRSKHWSVYLVTGMATMTALVIGLYSLGSWWQHVQDDWTYGMPRTYQTDAVVGHNHDSASHPSHFVALNLRGQVEVFELPAGDPTKVRVFLGPILSGAGADQVVVTIGFVDIDHDGTPDLVLRYGDSEEQQRLLAALSARTPPLSVQRATPLTHRLIEGHLVLASRIAREHCPPTCYASLLPDLIQEANLALIQATEQFVSTHEGDFTDYVCAWMRAGVKGAVSRAAMPIAVPYRVRVRAREEGTLEQWYRLQPVSLDRLLNEEEREESSLVATLVAPSIPETPPAARGESTRAFVEQLLSYLSPRARAVLRLRHGLVTEDDERPRTTGEIAQELGIAPDAVSAYERDGLRRLQALVKGEARLLPYQGRVAVSLDGADAPALERQQRQDIAQERRERLVQAYQRVREQGVKVTIDRLAEATGVPANLVAAFLRELRGKHCYRTGTADERALARWQRLEEAYRQLAAAGTTPSGQALARQAHTRQDTARAFLKARAQ